MFPYSREQLEAYAGQYAWPGEDEAMARGLAARERGFYTLDDLVFLEAWKVRGPYGRTVERNDPDYVVAVTRQALRPRGQNEAEAGDRLRLEVLTLLTGVRFRMASMLLHLGHSFDPAVGYPAMDVRTLRAVELGEPESYEDWSLYVDFAARCRQQASDTALDLRTVDRGLFHVAVPTYRAPDTCGDWWGSLRHRELLADRCREGQRALGG